ncbi:Sterol 3-beta-glucosyltransferase, partial [Ceratobasidium sp. 395]
MESAVSPPNSIQNPVHGTTIDTSPEELGLIQSHASNTLSDSHDSGDESGGGKGIVKRTVEKLGRGTSLNRSKKQAGETGYTRGHRSLFSLSRHKGRDKAAEDVTGILAGHASGAGDVEPASSIHTIHRPVARSRLATPAFGYDAQESPQPQLEAAEDYFSNPLSTDEDDGLRDFDEGTTPDSTFGVPNPFKEPSRMKLQLPADKLSMLEGKKRMPPPMRTASMATVRMKRRAKLADKLKDVFGIPEIQEVVAVLKSGTLSKKAQRTKRWNKHWFVLKNDVLSWYQSSADPYFPHGNIDLRYAISCDAHHEKGIRLRTNQKTITLQADSVPSRDEWVKAIRKVIFKAQNMGESVKIAIPYSVIDGVEKSTAMDFSETIEVKVIDKEEHFTLDSYFFAYFRDLPTALAQIKDVLKQYQVITPLVEAQVTDTTQMHRSIATSPVVGHLDRTTSAPPAP